MARVDPKAIAAMIALWTIRNRCGLLTWEMIVRSSSLAKYPNMPIQDIRRLFGKVSHSLADTFFSRRCLVRLAR
jgi:hypothetical protein